MAKSDLFIALANDLAKQIAQKNPTTSEALAGPAVRRRPRTHGRRPDRRRGRPDARQKMTPGTLLLALSGGLMGSYIHTTTGSNGVAPRVSRAARTTPRCCAMSACTSWPALRWPPSASRLPQETVDKEMEIAHWLQKAADQGKRDEDPPASLEKIAEEPIAALVRREGPRRAALRQGREQDDRRSPQRRPVSSSSGLRPLQGRR